MTSSSDSVADGGSLLRHRGFLCFLAARFLSSLAVQAQSVTIAWQIYATARLNQDVRHAALAVGMVGLAQFLPLFALTLTAGQAADRHDRRLISCRCLVVEVATSAGLAALAFNGAHSLWPIYAIAVAFGASRAFFSPSSTAMAPMLVPRALLPRSIAWSSLAWQLASIGGPALGGLLCAVSPGLSYAVCTGLYVLSVIGLLAIREPTKPAAQPGSRWALAKEGLAYVWTNKLVLGAISLDLFAVLLGGATALLPVYARDVLKVGSEGFGVLRSAPAVGAGVMAAILATRPIRGRAGLYMFAGVAVFGLATVVFALSKAIIYFANPMKLGYK